MSRFLNHIQNLKSRFQPKRVLILFSLGAIVLIVLSRFTWKIGINLSDSIECQLFFYTTADLAKVEQDQLIMFHAREEDFPPTVNALIAGKPLLKQVTCFEGDYLVCDGLHCTCNGAPAGLPIPVDQRPYSFYWNGTIPPGLLFVTGNHNPRSFDSRFWGFLPLGSIEGKELKCVF